MSHLWVFRRRPSCLVRYRHGGTTALYPWQTRDSMPALLYEAYAVAMAADRAATAEDNVLHFPGREQTREQPRDPGRSTPRSGPRGRGAKNHRE